MTNGTICSIERFAVHDGPGIRTTVFLKGCNMSCFWCHSPESIRPEPELQVFYHRCARCRRCAAVCPQSAHTFQGERHLFRRERCVACGACVRACPVEALELCGRQMTPDDVFAEVLKDRDFYQESGGGITLSGGEPLLQPDFATDLFAKCRTAGIHTALDTAGNVPADVFRTLVGERVDLVILDLKVMDDAEHARVTGVSNTRILENLEAVLMLGTPLTVRVPVVPGVNDNRNNMERCAARIAKGRGQVNVELLAFHRLGTAKYASLEMDYAAAHLSRPNDAVLSDLAAVFRAHDIAVELRLAHTVDTAPCEVPLPCQANPQPRQTGFGHPIAGE